MKKDASAGRASRVPTRDHPRKFLDRAKKSDPGRWPELHFRRVRCLWAHKAGAKARSKPSPCCPPLFAPQRPLAKTSRATKIA